MSENMPESLRDSAEITETYFAWDWDESGRPPELNEVVSESEKEKSWQYVDNPSEAPEWADVEEAPQAEGRYRYTTDNNPSNQSVESVLPSANEARDGEVSSQQVQQIEQELPGLENGAWDEVGDEGFIPNIAEVVATQEGVGVFMEPVGDYPNHDLKVMTADGEKVVSQDETSHVFQPGSEGSGESESSGSNEDEGSVIDVEREPEDVIENVSESPSQDRLVEEASNFAHDEGAQLGFEERKEIAQVTDEEIVNENRELPKIGALGADDEQQSRQFYAKVIEARERGWLDHTTGTVSMQDGGLHLPDRASGVFRPGVRDISGDIQLPTSERNPDVYVNSDDAFEWDGETEYLPIDEGDADKIDYVVSHEFGHSEHYRNLIENHDMSVEEIESDEFNSDMRDVMAEYSDEIEDEFGALASECPFEFAADVFSVISMSGVDAVSDEVLEAYTKIGGVAP